MITYIIYIVMWNLTQPLKRRTPETNTTLYINYRPPKLIFFKKKKKEKKRYKKTKNKKRRKFCHLQQHE